MSGPELMADELLDDVEIFERLDQQLLAQMLGAAGYADQDQLAELIGLADPVTMVDGLARASEFTLVMDEIERAGRALRVVARTMRPPAEMLAASWSSADRSVDVSTSGPVPAGLLMARPMRERLPLVELAEDLARRVGTILVVDDARFVASGGRCDRRFPGQVTIHLNHNAAGDQLPFTWAHELSHALDPDPFHVNDEPELERFADHLAVMLLDAEPRTLATAAPFISAALLDRTRPARPIAADPGLLAALFWLMSA